MLTRMEELNFDVGGAENSSSIEREKQKLMSPLLQSKEKKTNRMLRC